MIIEWTNELFGLLLLGAFHGINPGMGWLFAVGLGLQEQKRAAVWRSLAPLAVGHALAVAAAVLLILLVGRVLDADMIKWAVAAVLLLFGVFRLARRSHPRYGGMQVGPRDLVVWSFLMASAHGAGLMVLPFVIATAPLAEHSQATPARQDVQVEAAGHTAHEHNTMADASAIEALSLAGGHHHHAAPAGNVLPPEPLAGMLVTLVHTLGYLLITGVVAMVVYEKLGLGLLGKAWINLDLVWPVALILTAVFTLLV